ncbi:MAG TPA: signal recognition particle-docking protein FtsY [Bacteroidota bacterium]|nr:signal recognition particle-docking protein FtsY [Bacteroidota bacterium]
MSLLGRFSISRLRDGLAKTREAVATKISRLVFAKGVVDDDFLGQLEEILLSADVGMETTQKILDELKERSREKKYENRAELDRLVRESVEHVFDPISSVEDPFALPGDARPYVIMIVGVNGVGKTTTIGKLAHNYKGAGKSVLIGAADTFRAAANEQLEVWAGRAGVGIIQQAHGSDPAAVAFDTVRAAQTRGAEVVIIDTAGRLHTKVNLMEELKKIKRVIQKSLPHAPNEVLLVLDATTGQNAIQQARQFDAAVGLTGLVLTKLDGTAKGGIILAISRGLRIPVRFIGVGEQIDDLQPFDAHSFVNALFNGGAEGSGTPAAGSSN